MASIPGPATVSCPKCGSGGTYKPNTSNGATVATCNSCRKNFRIEIRDGKIFRTQ